MKRSRVSMILAVVAIIPSQVSAFWNRECWRNSDCDSGRCEADFMCYNKLREGEGCNEDSDCISDICSWRFKCAECDSPDDCASGRCESDGMCYDKLQVGEGCNEDTDCISDICSWRFTCAECDSPDDCASGRCESDGLCHDKLEVGEGCNEDNDCVSNICNWLFKCAECSTDNDCPSGRCETDGLCYDKIETGFCNEDSDCQSDHCSIFFRCSRVDPNSRSGQLMAEMDFYTDFVVDVITPALDSSLPNTHLDVVTDEEEVGWTKTGSSFTSWRKDSSVDQFALQVSNQNYMIVEEDDYFGSLDFLTEVVNGLGQNELLVGMTDKSIVASVEDTMNVAMNYGILDLFPDPIYPDFNLETDESFSRMFFYGLGAVLLIEQDQMSTSSYGPFEVDIPLQDLPTRDGYRRLGAKVYFNFDQEVTAVFDYAKNTMYEPGDGGWDNAKMLAKVSCLVLVTAKQHLVWTHLILSNSMTRNKILHLSPSHPIRRLLKVFTFRTNRVNRNAAELLTPELGMLHRAVGLEYSAMETLFDMAYADSTVFQPFPQLVVNAGLADLENSGQMPYLSEGKVYYEKVETFVRAWLQEAGSATQDDQARAFYDGVRADNQGQSYNIPVYSETAMVDLLSQVIFTVTAYHELVGGIGDHVAVPSRNGARLLETDNAVIDLQSYLLFGIITASTSLRMPYLVQSFDNFFGIGGAPSWERTIWDNFVSDLEGIIASRDYSSFEYFNPSRFECAVSV